MGLDACIEELRRETGGKINDEELRAILQGLKERRDAAYARGQGTVSGAEAAKAAAKTMTEQEAAEMAVMRRNARINLAARVARRGRIEQRVRAGVALPDAIRSEIYRLATPTEGSQFSGEAEARSMAKVYRAGIETDLKKAGLFDVARKGALEPEWTREMFELSKGADGKPGVSGSREALKIAQVLHKWQTLAKVNLNKAGAWIGDYSGYIARTAHDADKIYARGKGFEPWRDAILPRLDADKTFGGEDPETFLRNVWHALVTGVHMTDGGPDLKDAAFTGPGNLAKRVSQDRVLHFRDADAWRGYNQAFGFGNALDAVYDGVGHAARQTALMQRWGTNPRAEFQSDLRDAAMTYRNAPDQVRALNAAARGLQTRFDYLDGTANIPENRLGAQIAAATRNWESMAKLGGVLFTHLSVLATKPAELTYHGVGLLQAYGDGLASVFRGRGWADSEVRDVMDLLGAGIDGMHSSVTGRFSWDDSLPGTFAKAQNVFFHWTGLTYMVAAQKAGAMWTLARFAGRELGKMWAEVSPALRQSLEGIGVGERDWRLLNAVDDHATANGRTFLTPDAALRTNKSDVAALLASRGELPGDATAGQIAAKVAAYQQQLALRMHAWYDNAADRATITPGIAEKAFLLGNNHPGSGLGEVLRFVAQFKQWPVAMMRQGVGREIYGNRLAGGYTLGFGGTPAAIAGVLHMAVAATVMGYLRMVLSDLSKGETPRDPHDVATWGAAIAQGGGLGILGDYLFGEYGREAQNFGETLAGPVIGTGVGSVLSMWNDAKDGNKKGFDAWWRRLAADGFQIGKNNTPFLNLFYTRTALDHLFLYQVQEALNPGFLRRYERRVKEQTGQTFILRPTQSLGVR